MGSRRHYSIVMDRKGNIISENCNNDGDQGHAEKRAIKKALKKGKKNKVNGGKIVVVRDVRRTNQDQIFTHLCGYSKPCCSCMHYIKVSGIKEIIYSNMENIETLKLY